MAAARDGRSGPRERGGDDQSVESLIEEYRDRRILRIGKGSAEPEQGPEGASGTAQSEAEPSAAPEAGGPEAS
ncbi:hypothetical protein ABT093_31300 [Kitasatospora sp. NPDC002551]|uniref:hypothetical protein n=1 Tax=unclassified Kitasatospora TaxID=2633591 RepID=UPI00331B4FCD